MRVSEHSLIRAGSGKNSILFAQIFFLFNEVKPTMELTFPFSLQELECLWELDTTAVAAIPELVKTRDKEEIFFFLPFENIL